MADKQELLRELPAVQDLLRDPFLEPFASIPRPLIVAAVQAEIAAARARLLAGKSKEGADADLAAIRRRVARRLARRAQPGPHAVLNLTGILVHTNLGRAPLAPEVAAHAAAVGAGYSDLEYDLDAGARGSRHAHVEEMLVAATGAEAAIAVNNNAAAVMLLLAALAAGKDVIVSRGELVEIGGSFRVPDILRASGARLVEVGTTNRTTAKDYAAAITPDTALLLKVHPSNFRVVGFTAAPSEEELATVARAAKVPLVHDVGSGMLVDLAALGLPTSEPFPARSLKWSDAVTFSGDKLLGGPQAGIIAGRKSIVERARKHPLARAMRLDKLSLAALAATLWRVLDPARVREIPVVRMALEPAAETRARAERLAAALRDAGVAAVEVVASEAQIGGGSTPGESLASFAVALGAPAGHSVAATEAALREGDPPVIARVHEERILLDARTLPDAEVARCAASVAGSIHRVFGG